MAVDLTSKELPSLPPLQDEEQEVLNSPARVPQKLLQLPPLAFEIERQDTPPPTPTLTVHNEEEKEWHPKRFFQPESDQESWQKVEIPDQKGGEDKEDQRSTKSRLSNASTLDHDPFKNYQSRYQQPYEPLQLKRPGSGSTLPGKKLSVFESPLKLISTLSDSGHGASGSGSWGLAGWSPGGDGDGGKREKAKKSKPSQLVAMTETSVLAFPSLGGSSESVIGRKPPLSVASPTRSRFKSSPESPPQSPRSPYTISFPRLPVPPSLGHQRDRHPPQIAPESIPIPPTPTSPMTLEPALSPFPARKLSQAQPLPLKDMSPSPSRSDLKLQLPHLDHDSDVMPEYNKFKLETEESLEQSGSCWTCYFRC